MSMSDPLADMLTRIRNASMVKHDTVEIPLSKLKVHVAENLKKEGFINDFSIIEDSRQGSIKIDLKYSGDDNAVITGIKRVSKPGCRVYVQSSDIPKVMSGLGISILSTSKGVVTDKEARKLGIGGELLCDVW
jgi:small subunit ribosomal protein S8